MIALNELIDASGFVEKVQELAKGFRQKFGLAQVHQLGLVVSSVEKSAEDLEKKGIGPFFIASGAPVLWQERGEKKSFQGKLGLAYRDGIELELLEPGQGSDFYRQHLEPQGKIIVQHLGLLTGDVDASAKKLEDAGYPVWVRGKINTGPLKTDFAYMDTITDAGFVIEFISWRLFGFSFPPRPGIIHALGRLEKWSGIRSIKT